MEDILQQYRKEIDHLDEEIIELLAKRIDVVRAVGKLKKQHNIQPLDEKRWQNVLESRTKIAEKLHLSQNFIINLFNLIHHHTLAIEYTYCHPDEGQDLQGVQVEDAEINSA